MTDLFAPVKVEAACAECAKGGIVYQMTCDSCWVRWFKALPNRRLKIAAWRSRPDLHQRLRQDAGHAAH